MTAQPLKDVSPGFAGFYVPQYEILIDGDGLPDTVLHDVLEVTYTDNIDELDYFEITVANWDSQKRQAKYIGSETAEILNDKERARLYTLFEPCAKKVRLSMGYSGQLQSLITATFTTMEPEFPDSGAPTLKVRGLNVLHQLRRKKYDDAFENKKYSQIAREIANREDDDLHTRRFPIQVDINEEAQAAESPNRFVAQKKEFDIDFLWKLARKQGYVVTIHEGEQEQSRRLYFGPSHTLAERPLYELEWGKSLLSFSPRITTANQFRSVTVHGWNRDSQKPISAKVDFDDEELNRMNRDLHEMVRKCDPREEEVVDEPVFSKDEAEQRARAILLDQSKQMVKASGSTVGLPGLRAGSKVDIKGIGSRLSGTYFVTETTHVLNDNGYITNFQARREEPDPPTGDSE